MFEESGCLWEKFDVVAGTKGIAEYGVEQQMGWTAAMFVAFAKELGHSTRFSGSALGGDIPAA